MNLLLVKFLIFYSFKLIRTIPATRNNDSNKSNDQIIFPMYHDMELNGFKNNEKLTNGENSIKYGFNEINKRDDVLKFIAAKLNEANEASKKEDNYINKKSIDLGLNPFRLDKLNKTHLNKNKNSRLNLRNSLPYTNYKPNSVLLSITKIQRTKKDDDTTNSVDDSENDSTANEDTVDNSENKPGEKPKKKKKLSKKAEHEVSSVNSNKLSKSQLKQIYSFIKSKDKGKESTKEDKDSLVTSLLLMGSGNEISSHLKDSMAAKAANTALLKWHLDAPTADLHQLEHVYNKLYEYFYNFYDHHSATEKIHHYHHVNYLDDDLFGYHHHHHHHNHKHFNLLDFLTKKYKNNNEKSDIDMGIIPLLDDLDNHHHHHHHHRHHHHHSTIYGPYNHLNPLTAWYINHNIPVDPYYNLLKNRINYYRMQNLTPPLALIDEYNHYNRLYGRSPALFPFFDVINKNDFFETNPHMHIYDSHFDPLTGHHYSSEIQHEVHKDPFHQYDEIEDHGYPHHLIRNIYEHHPIYDEFGREIIYPSSPFLPSIISPPINLSPRPVACNNYPQHSSTGFKSFISVESCMQPSYLSSSGTPAFGDGCTFRFLCQVGYEPQGGIASSITCSNGLWSASAVCVKQEAANIDLRSKINNPNENQSPLNQIRSINQLPSLNIAKRQIRSIERYEDDELNDSEEEQKYLIDDDEILINHLNKRSQTKNINESKAQSLNNEDNSKNINFFYSNQEPVKFLDSSLSKESQKELLVEKSLFDQKNYLQNIENLEKKLTKKSQEKIDHTLAETSTLQDSKNMKKSNDSLKINQKKIHSLLNKIQNIYEKLDTEKNYMNSPQTSTSFIDPKMLEKLSTTSKESTVNTTPITVKNNIGKFFQLYNKVSNLPNKSDQLIYSNNELNDELPGMLNNDSEKTIYESFYELLDTKRRNDVDESDQSSKKIG